ncbi:FAD-dependent oxidoreductase [Candidatus Falkowbacteria bacterium]|nr:FAD-dependent oxidoreductase [Candidatus Falkowbacteria bacterium]
MYDTIIIGAGPAGVSAAIYAVRREMKTLLISKDIGGQVGWAGEIENYPGFPSIKNYELVGLFEKHLKSAGVEHLLSEVKAIVKNQDDVFEVVTSKDKYLAKTVIVTMGLVPRRLAISGEEQFNGKGVSYCANCDGPLFRHKTVAVVGGGNAALDAAEVLSKIASKVYLIHRSDKFRAFDMLVDEVKARPNIEIVDHAVVKEIVGNEKVSGIKIDRADGKTSDIEVDGVFIEIGRIAHTDVLKELVRMDEKNQIIIDEKCNTSLSGMFAAGDVTNGEFKQISIASGQGTIAALAAYQYLQLKLGKPQVVVRDLSKK